MSRSTDIGLIVKGAYFTSGCIACMKNGVVELIPNCELVSSSSSSSVSSLSSMSSSSISSLTSSSSVLSNSSSSSSSTVALDNSSSSLSSSSSSSQNPDTNFLAINTGVLSEATLPYSKDGAWLGVSSASGQLPKISALVLPVQNVVGLPDSIVSKWDFVQYQTTTYPYSAIFGTYISVPSSLDIQTLKIKCRMACAGPVSLSSIIHSDLFLPLTLTASGQNFCDLNYWTFFTLSGLQRSTNVIYFEVGLPVPPGDPIRFRCEWVTTPLNNDMVRNIRMGWNGYANDTPGNFTDFYHQIHSLGSNSLRIVNVGTDVNGTNRWRIYANDSGTVRIVFFPGANVPYGCVEHILLNGSLVFAHTLSGTGIIFYDIHVNADDEITISSTISGAPTISQWEVSNVDNLCHANLVEAD